MRLLLVLLAFLALAATAQAQSGDFQYGVASAEVTSTSALLWTRAPASGPVDVRYSGGGRKAGATLTASPEDDNTVKAKLSALKPGTRYTFRFAQNGATSQTGHFVTAPPNKSKAKVRFTWSGDADAQPATPGGPPGYNDFQVYGRMAAAKGAFAINLGDTIYSDSELGGPIALTLADKWAKYKQNLALANLQKLRASTSVFNQWDDHEFINDFTPQDYRADVYPAGVQAFLDYMPATYSQPKGLYRHFRWGSNLELFFPDERSFRSAKADVDCINPQTNTPDLAPTAPQVTRSIFGLAIPSLNAPVSAGCLAAINDPNRTMLGAAQLARLIHDVKKSKATFKVIVNEVPLMDLYIQPYDEWDGYAAERAKLLAALKKVSNVVVLTTDHHADLAGEITNDTLGKLKHTGIEEIVTGPVATKTFGREIDENIGAAGAHTPILNQFLKPDPPAGLGLDCANLNTFSYGQVDVTAKKLTVKLLDINGKPVRDKETGPACKSIVVKARR